jgi:hypothetical protein
MKLPLFSEKDKKKGTVNDSSTTNIQSENTNKIKESIVDLDRK